MKLIEKENQDSQEVPFSFEELFFSRTDERGIILSGNSVFQRISQYNWDELIHKPHNIIRHPDMPKAVFYLLWDFLKKGKPICAYVKNRAKDGRYYWVFAIATPVEGGYLSVRLKPSSAFFPIVQDAYRTLLAYERDTKARPKQSMEHLLEVLKTLGFNSYDAFMSVAIRKELESRDAQLGRAKEPFLARFEELSQRATALMTEAAAIFSSYEANRYVPLNLQIQSAQLGERGRTIGVISGNFSIVSAELKEEIQIFNQTARDVFDRIYEGQLLLCTARVQKELLQFFQKETVSEHQDDPSQEMVLLERQRHEYEQKANAGLQAIMRDIERFQEDCQRMKKCTASLEVIRVMGKVDAARLSLPQSGLNELIEELKTFQSTISESLGKIEKHSASMRYDAQGVVASLR